VVEPTRAQESTAENLVAVYQGNLTIIETFGEVVSSVIGLDPILKKDIHSMKVRLKDPDHLKAKLIRKMQEAAEAERDFDIDESNLLVKINDLVGVRILHLYTRQVSRINEALKEVFAEQSFDLIEGPIARTWDDETRDFFDECGIETKASKTMYTSVHYVIGSSSKTTVTCEIQVRTLMEEVWGEVDHLLNYPVPSEVLSSREQLKVLAKVTASASRLVDSIIITNEAAQGK
jgi:ppGpp synthetase/RelA/SpoT-type nucleotidyltranferase